MRQTIAIRCQFLEALYSGFHVQEDLYSEVSCLRGPVEWESDVGRGGGWKAVQWGPMSGGRTMYNGVSCPGGGGGLYNGVPCLRRLYMVSEVPCAGRGTVW